MGVLGGRNSGSDEWSKYSGLIGSHDVPIPKDYPKGAGGKRIYDIDEMQRLMDALNRIGISELALPPENFRPNPTTDYAMPNLPYTLPEGTPFQF
jgi:hypothetical protein